uniref:Uncharacterized protein n=1 Tax=Strombidium inclinatum TaxID=197538 RepID=A0A7S3IST7_9SPIT
MELFLHDVVNLVIPVLELLLKNVTLLRDSLEYNLLDLMLEVASIITALAPFVVVFSLHLKAIIHADLSADLIISEAVRTEHGVLPLAGLIWTRCFVLRILSLIVVRLLT